MNNAHIRSESTKARPDEGIHTRPKSGCKAVFRQLLVLLVLPAAALAHDPAASPPPDQERLIRFPDVEGYHTLVVDLHTHSVFSDGHVWPKIRVGEALRDGLDALAITEHLEWQPHRADIPHPDRNGPTTMPSRRPRGTTC